MGAFLLSVKATTAEELVIVGAGEQGLQEVWRHQLSVPGQPQILPGHYPDHPNGRGVTQPRLRPQNESERAFLAIGGGLMTRTSALEPITGWAGGVPFAALPPTAAASGA